MTIEVTLLVWSTALFGLYVGTQAILYRMQHGVMFAATGPLIVEDAGRDDLVLLAARALTRTELVGAKCHAAHRGHAAGHP